MRTRILTAASRHLLAAGAFLGMACSSHAGFEDPGQSGSAIINGVDSPESDNAVVLVTQYREITEGGTTRCSGTLVAPNLLLTAAHCLLPLNDQQTYTCSASGAVINGGSGGGELGQAGPPELLSVFVGQDAIANQAPTATGVRVFSSGTTNICRGDVGLLEFSPAIEDWRMPVGLDSVVSAGLLLSLIGYGDSTAGVEVRQRRDEVRVVDTGIPPGAFAIGEGPCFGDSGGPAVSMETGAVVGVYSRIFGGACDAGDVRNTYTQLSAFKDVILNAFEQAGARPWLEGEPEPTGDAGAAGAGGASGMGGAMGEPEPPPKKKDDDDGGCSVASPSKRGNGVLAAWLVGLAGLAARRRRATTTRRR